MTSEPHGERDAAKLRAILDSAVDAIITIDSAGIIDSVNPAALTLFQYDAPELVGRNIKMLMPEPYHSEHDSYIERHLRTGEKRIIGIGREVRGLKKDKTVFPLHLSVSSFTVRGSIYFTGIIHDLTERKRAELALHTALKMESIGQLTGGIAHDFNNLLTVITGNLELLDMRLTDQDLRDLLKDAQDASELGSKLTDQLLAFARRSPLEPEVLDLNTLVIGLTRLLHRTLGDHVELSSALATGLWPVLADRGQLESAIVNLAVNARDAMPEGGRLIVETANVVIDRMTIEDAPGLVAGEYVRISVADSGQGIEPEIVPRVFEPFFTTKDVGRGTGLGLSMVYGFASQSRGTATIYSEPGTGTTVNIYLPRHLAPPAEVAASAAAAADDRPGRGELILVVEDDPRVRDLTVRRLDTLGYRVAEAENGPSALAMLPDLEEVALLFTDLVMPGGMSGYDLIAAARTKRPDMPVLITSGYAEDLVNGSRLAEQKIPLLRKPYRQADLAAAVRRAMTPS